MRSIEHGCSGLATHVASARAALAAARADLDAAVGAMPVLDGEEGMAPPALLGLLFRAVAAKDRLRELESFGTTPAVVAL